MNVSRKKILVMSITIIMMILFSNIFGFTLPNNLEKFGITTQKVNFRKTANLNSSSIVKTINKDTNFKILGKIDNFYVVLLESGEIGLVSSDYSKTTDNSQNVSYLEYQTLDKNGTISESVVNLRGGPGTNFKSYKKLYRNDNVKIIGKINNWYVAITNDNTVGMIRDDLLSLQESSNDNSESTLPNTAETVLSLINDLRKQNNIEPLKVNELLNSTAQTKAQDMVKNDYFAHESPTYGSPFIMMKNAGITYKTAGENIAGNSSVENAVNLWMESDLHSQNILSNAYNYVGIGIEKSDTYGYVIVVMFIGK